MSSDRNIPDHAREPTLWARVHTAKELGQSVAEFRRSAAMSQAELAEWMGVDRTTVVRLESGSLGALDRLMAALAVVGADLVISRRTDDVRVTPGAKRGD